MPIFEFECEVCDKVKEVLFLYSDIIEVPICCRKSMTRKMGTIHFKVKGHNSENGYSYKPSAVDNPPR